MHSGVASSPSLNRCARRQGSGHSTWSGSVPSVRSGMQDSGADLRCFCGLKAIVYLSRTELNPNRHFFGCPLF